MRTRFSQRFGIAMMLACTLIGNAVMTVSASAAPSAESAAPSAESAVPAPVPGELLTTFIGRAVFPGSPPGCYPATVSKVLPDRKRQLVADVPCSSRAVIPQAITLPAGFESKPGSAFVAKVSELSGASSAEAANAIAAAAGVDVSHLSTMTVASLGRSILLTQAEVTNVTEVPGTAEKTTGCIRSGAGQVGCVSITNPLLEALIWGAVGAGIGTGWGAVGVVVGAVIGFIIGLL